MPGTADTLDEDAKDKRTAMRNVRNNRPCGRIDTIAEG
jgi:hypothetical protein